MVKGTRHHQAMDHPAARPTHRRQAMGRQERRGTLQPDPVIHHHRARATHHHQGTAHRARATHQGDPVTHNLRPPRPPQVLAD